MKVLIVSYYFAPYNTIGAVRVSKLAKYWTRQGHDVKVLTAKNVPLLETLPLEIAQENIIDTPWFNVDFIPELLFGGKAKVAKRGYPTSNSLANKLKLAYKTIFNFPDSQIGWYPYALRYAKKLLQDWKPDFIYASATPFTSLIVAKSLSSTYQIPWFAELRDLWVDNHYHSYPKVRRFIEEKLEKQILSTATGLITVSQPLADKLRQKYSLPIAVILNGFDSEDFPEDMKEQFFDLNYLNIVYTGTIQLGYQDPSPLFAALASLGTEAEKVRIHFYGRLSENTISQIAGQYKIGCLVKVHSPVAYGEALQIQIQADILLLLLYNDPAEKGVYTGKLFEYIGARRPILGIGTSDGVAAELIEQREIGFVLNEPSQIATKLQYWLKQKNENLVIPSLPKSATVGLERKERAKDLESFILQTLGI